MKKFLLSLATVLAGAFTMSAAPVVEDWTTNAIGLPTSSADANVEYGNTSTSTGIYYTFLGCYYNAGNINTDPYMMFYSKNENVDDVYVTFTLADPISKIGLTTTSGCSENASSKINVYADDELIAKGFQVNQRNHEFTVDIPAAYQKENVTFKIGRYQKSYNQQFSSFKYYPVGEGDDPVIVDPEDPEDPDPETPADIELGEGEALAWSVVYVDSTNDSTNDLTAKTYAPAIESGADYTTFDSCSKVYNGKEGIKFSSNKADGTITLNVAEDYQVNATKIILKASTIDSTAKLAVNGSAAQYVADYMTFELDGEALETITIAATKRCYVKAIYVVVAAEDEPDPDPVDPDPEDPTVYEAPEVMVATMEGYEAIEFTAEAVEFASLAAIYVTIPEGAEVYYTMDGSDPCTSATAELFDEDFDEFITVYESCTVKLVAKYDVEGEANYSAVLSQKFVKAAYPQPTIKVVSDCGNPNFFVNSAIVTITAEGVAGVMYTLDGTPPSSMSPSTYTIAAVDGVVEKQITITEDAEIVAVSTDGMMTTSEAVTATITKWEKPNNHVEYRPVTSKSELTPGNAYIFVAHYVNAKNAIDTYYAMGTEVGNNNLKAVEAEIHPDGSVYLEKVAGNNINEFYLEAAGADTWRFFTYTNWTSGEENAKQYLQTVSTSTRTLKTAALPANAELATVTITYPEVSVEAEEATDAPAPTIKFQAYGSDSKNSKAMDILCFNYASASNQMFNVYNIDNSSTASCFHPMLYTAGAAITTGVELVAPEANDAPAVYYNLQGVRVANPSNGIYVVVRGNKVSKEIVR